MRMSQGSRIAAVNVCRFIWDTISRERQTCSDKNATTPTA